MELGKSICLSTLFAVALVSLSLATTLSLLSLHDPVGAPPLSAPCVRCRKLHARQELGTRLSSTYARNMEVQVPGVQRGALHLSMQLSLGIARRGPPRPHLDPAPRSIHHPRRCSRPRGSRSIHPPIQPSHSERAPKPGLGQDHHDGVAEGVCYPRRQMGQGSRTAIPLEGPSFRGRELLRTIATFAPSEFHFRNVYKSFCPHP